MIDWGFFHKPEDYNVFSCGVMYLCLSYVYTGSGIIAKRILVESLACALHTWTTTSPYLIPGIGINSLRHARDIYERLAKVSSTTCGFINSISSLSPMRPVSEEI